MTAKASAAQLRTMIQQARAVIAQISPGRLRDNRTARLDAEEARLFPKPAKPKS
jgi:hypothetical protein